MKIACKIFGHKWKYSFSQYYGSIVNFRACSHCGVIEELHDRYEPAFGKDWYRLVSYTEKGAKTELKEFYKK